jgi:PKD domain/K319L-like, PKD domain
MSLFYSNFENIKLSHLFSAGHKLFGVFLILQLSACGGGGGGGSDDSPSTTPESQQAALPVAVIDTRLNYKVGDIVTVDGTQSTVDTGQDIVSYTWDLNSPDDSEAQLSSNNTVKKTFTPDTTGQYTVSLVVNDGQRSSTATTITIQADNVDTNSTPNARISVDQDGAAVGSEFFFDGSASNDPDLSETDLQYVWTLDMPEGSNSLMTFQTDSRISGSFIPDTVGDYTLSLTVTDSDPVPASSEKDSLLIKAVGRDVEQAVASIEVGTNYSVNDQISVNGSSSVVPAGESLSWELTQYPGDTPPVLTNSNGLNPKFVPLQAGEYVLKLSITDGQNSISDQVLIVVGEEDPTQIELPDIRIVGQFLASCVSVDPVASSVRIKLNGNVEISLDNDLNVNSGYEDCRFSYKLAVPDGVRLATSAATLVGSHNGVSKVTLQQREVSQDDTVSETLALDDSVGDFDVTTAPYRPVDNCGDTVWLQSRILVFPRGGSVTINGESDSAALKITNTYEQCEQ